MPTFDIDSTGPTVTAVRFSNGVIANTKVPVTSYVNSDDKKQKILTATVENMTYVGQNFGEANRIPDTDCDYYMGIHDKSTGRIRVVPASLVQLDPWFEDKDKDKNKDQNQNETTVDKLTKLTSGFGSGKSQRLVQKKVKEKLDDDVVTSSTLSMVEKVSEESLQVQEMEQSNIFPRHNDNAERPDEVYSLTDLITRDVLRSLTDVASELSDTTPEDVPRLTEEKKYFSFILSRVGILSTHTDARLLQSQCLAYLQYLMQLFLMKAHELRAKFPLPREWPQTTRDYLLELFTVEIKEPGKPYRRTVPAHKKDKMLAHILILCLKMSEFCLELSPLVVDLKIPVRKLVNTAQCLGCVVRKSKTAVDSYTVVLKLPLTFPTPSKGKGKRKAE